MKIKSLFRAKKPLAGLLAFVLLGSASSVRADEVYSQIVGAIAVSVPGESDVVLSFPFKRSASFRGAVVSVSGDVVTVATDSLQALDLSGGSYYVFVEASDSTAMRGQQIDVTAKTDSSLTLGGAVLTGLVADDVISVRRHWTLGDAFPDGFGSVQEENPGLRTIELIIPDSGSLGAGLTAKQMFFFYGDSWRELSKPLGESADATILRPGSSLVVRNRGTDDVKSYFFGEVVDAPIAIPLQTNTDNFVGIGRPLGLTLDDLDSLEGVLEANDRLLIYSLGAGKNKQPKQYEYTGSQWEEVDSDVDAGATEIKAEQGIAIRRAAADGVWVNEWSLPQ